MKIMMREEGRWVNVEEQELVIKKRGSKGWFDLETKKQRPNKKISGSWHLMGQVDEKC